MRYIPPLAITVITLDLLTVCKFAFKMCPFLFHSVLAGGSYGDTCCFFFPETMTDTRLKVLFLCQTQCCLSSAPFAARSNRAEGYFFLQHPVCPGSGMSMLWLITVCVWNTAIYCYSLLGQTRDPTTCFWTLCKHLSRVWQCWCL